MRSDKRSAVELSISQESYWPLVSGDARFISLYALCAVKFDWTCVDGRGMLTPLFDQWNLLIVPGDSVSAGF